MKFLLLLFVINVIWAGPIAEKKPIRRHPGGRIIDGELAKTGQFPFQVAIYLDTDDGQYFCGGALISNQWILTSGHCVNNVKVFTLQLGANQLQSDDPNRLTVATVNAVPHPRFNENTNDNDIGLIKLHLPIEFNQYIKPIALPKSNMRDEVKVAAIGWGQTGDFGSGVVNDLMYVLMMTITNAECRLTYGDQITDNMVCAVGNYQEGICSGDNGGPLVEIDMGTSPIHVGVNSFVSGSGCETPEPSGFTRTEVYRDWIRDVTQI